MNKGKHYEKPDMEMLIMLTKDVVTTSELTNGGSGTGDFGGLPSETNLPSF